MMKASGEVLTEKMENVIVVVVMAILMVVVVIANSDGGCGFGVSVN